jgi:hypothetical protein
MFSNSIRGLSLVPLRLQSRRYSTPLASSSAFGMTFCDPAVWCRRRNRQRLDDLLSGIDEKPHFFRRAVCLFTFVG